MSGQMEVMFNGGVPMLDGTWYDPNTGNSITVRDTLFEDNNLVILTTDGRRIPYTQMERYVKSDKPIGKKPKVDPTIVKDTKREEALAQPATWDDLILDDDKDILSKPIESTLSSKKLNLSKTQPKNIDNEILERALRRWDNDIKVDITINWGAKKSTINNLIDMFGFTEEDFANYLLNKTKDIDLKEPMKLAVKHIIED